MSLTLSSTLSPFPYAAAALAAYTKQAELIFDDAATDAALDLSGAVISGEDKIVEELAKVGGLSSDSTTVRPRIQLPEVVGRSFSSGSSPHLISQGTRQGNRSPRSCGCFGRVR